MDDEVRLVELTDVIRRTLRSRTSDRHLIEDITQDAVLRVAVAQRQLEPNALRAYAIVTARNGLAGHHRKQDVAARHAHRVVDYPTLAGAEELTLEREETDALTQAVDSLAEVDRRLLLAHEVDGVGVGELAALHDVSPGAMAMRLARARAVLRLEFLLALRRVTLPSDRCRQVLLAISAGDQRRQVTLDASEHLVGCEVCSQLSEPLVERRRGAAAWWFLPVPAWFARLARKIRTSHAAQAATGVAIAVVVTAVALAVSAGGGTGRATPAPSTTSPSALLAPAPASTPPTPATTTPPTATPAATAATSAATPSAAPATPASTAPATPAPSTPAAPPTGVSTPVALSTPVAPASAAATTPDATAPPPAPAPSTPSATTPGSGPAATCPSLAAAVAAAPPPTCVYRLAGMVVTQVPADEGFWIRYTDGAALWVHLVGKGESPQHVVAGDAVTLEASIVAVTPSADTGLPAAQEGLLAARPIFLAVRYQDLTIDGGRAPAR